MIFTIGHSTHSWERFAALLSSANVTAVADVRTSPYSRHSPHFNREELCEELRSGGISCAFLGKELGGRPTEQKLYCEGVADYERMAQTSEFEKGLDRVLEGAGKYRTLPGFPFALQDLCARRRPVPGSCRGRVTLGPKPPAYRQSARERAKSRKARTLPDGSFRVGR